MSSALAIISKAVFEAGAPDAAVGQVLAIQRYAATPKALDGGLDASGALFLVTVRPPDETLWLVAVLDRPKKSATGWDGSANTIAIVDISRLKSKLAFANGKGLPTEPGKLGMSLQTPRILTDADIVLLRAALGGQGPKVAASPANTAKPTNATKPATTEKPEKVGKAGKAASVAASAASLEDVEAAFKSNAPTALTAALAYWRATRAPEAADLVDAISSRVHPAAVTEQPAITKLAMTKDPLALRALLDAAANQTASYLPTLGKLLAAFPDDPRLSLAVATWAQDPPTTSSSTYPFWSASIDAMIRIGDVRVLPLIAKRLKQPKGDSQFWPKFYTALTRAQTKIVRPQALDAATMKRLAKLTATAGTLAASVPKPSSVTAIPASRDSGPLLSRALEHLGAGRLVAAVSAMAEQWRLVRAPGLADMIDRVDRLLPTYDRPLREGKGDAWMELFEADPAANLPQLLLNIHAGYARSVDARLSALATLPDDPRISFRITELCHGRHAGPERTQYWKAIYDMLAQHRDVRTLEPLVAEHGEFNVSGYNNHQQARRIIGPWVKAPGEPPALANDDAARLAKLATAITKLERAHRDEHELVAAIAADWKSEAPRLVYADWLLEREHPRGELLALEARGGKQSAAERKRSGELFAVPYIYGAFADFMAYNQGNCERGLYAEITTDYRVSTLTYRRCAQLPMAQLVTALVVSREVPEAADLALFSAAVPGLKTLTFESGLEDCFAFPGWKAKGKNMLVRA